ncbi:MAG: PKD domain-containing protein [Thermoplasmata archaeon]|nr:PKD domain-containing protein [Thermoplasmata archaeon]
MTGAHRATAIRPDAARDGPWVILAILILLVAGLAVGAKAPSTTSSPVRTEPLDSGGLSFEKAWTSLTHPFGAQGACVVASMGSCQLHPRPASSPSSWYWDDLINASGPAPPCRGDQSLAYDAADSKVILFGGLSGSCTGAGGSAFRNDTWAFRGGNWTDLTPTIGASPSPRWQPGFAYDAADGYLLLFGGQTPSGKLLNETWSFVGGKWTNRTSSVGTAPSPRFRTQMTYNAGDGYVLLFGGLATTGFGSPLNDTWKFHALTWTQLNTTGKPTPPARAGGGFGYDASDAYTVLFGGVDAAVVGRNDTWTFTAGNWTNATSAGAPPGRWLAAMAYDPNVSRIVLFGGCVVPGCFGALNDTWTFAAGRWASDTSNLTIAPVNRGATTLADDPVDGWLVLFGGAPGTPTPAYLGDTWTFPLGPFEAALAFRPNPIALGTSIKVVTDLSTTRSVNTYAYSGLPTGCSSLNASQLACTPRATGTYLVHVNVTNSTGVRAEASTALRVLPQVSPGAWLNVTTAVPYAPTCRGEPAVTYDAADHYVLLFGGLTERCGPYTATIFLNDTWAYANGNWTNLTGSLVNSVAPSPRWGPGIACDAKDGYVVLFGGLDTNFNALGDTWTYVAKTWKELKGFNNSNLPGPSARWRMSMAYDPADGYVLGFGGAQFYCFCLMVNETWAFAGGAWTLISNGSTPSPGPRFAVGLTYDQLDGYMLLFGGGLPGIVGINETWTYLNGTWTELFPATSPSARWVPPMDYDPSRKAVMLFGGTLRQGAYYSANDTWSFTSGLWTNLTGNYTVAPGPRGSTSLAFHGRDNYTVMFGGSNNPSPSEYNDTWLLVSHAIFATASIAPRAVDANQSFLVTVTAIATSSPLTYHYDGLPSGCSSLNASTLRCTPGTSGAYHLEINVSDPSGAHVTVNRTIVVATELATPALAVSPASLDLGRRLFVNTTVVGGVAPYAFQYVGLPFGCFGPYPLASLVCTPTQAGIWNISVRVTDVNGFQKVSSTTRVQVYPTFSATAKVNVSEVDVYRATTYTATIIGGGGGFQFLWTSLPSGCTAGSVGTFTCVPTSTGVFTSQLTVQDATGAVVVTSAVPLIVNPPPQLTAQVGPAQGVVPLSVAVNVSESLGTAPYALLYDFGDGTTLPVNASTAHTYANPGTYTIRVRMTDSGGDAAYANATAVAVGPLTAGLSAAATSITNGQPLTLTVRPSGGTGVYTITWQGLPAGCVGANVTTLTCTPTSIGQAFPTVRVRDSLGLGAHASVSVTIYPALSLAVNATPLGDCRAPFGFQLAVLVSGGRAPVTVAWTFGDGTGGSTAATVEHNYTAAGSFTARATARDGDNATANSTTTVVAAAGTSCGAATGLGGVSGSSFWWIAVAAIAVAALLVGVLLVRRRRARTAVEEPPYESPPSLGPFEGETVPEASEEPAPEIEGAEPAGPSP